MGGTCGTCRHAFVAAQRVHERRWPLAMASLAYDDVLMAHEAPCASLVDGLPAFAGDLRTLPGATEPSDDASRLWHAITWLLRGAEFADDATHAAKERTALLSRLPASESRDWALAVARADVLTAACDLDQLVPAIYGGETKGPVPVDDEVLISLDFESGGDWFVTLVADVEMLIEGSLRRGKWTRRHLDQTTTRCAGAARVRYLQANGNRRDVFKALCGVGTGRASGHVLARIVGNPHVWLAEDQLRSRQLRGQGSGR